MPAFVMRCITYRYGLSSLGLILMITMVTATDCPRQPSKIVRRLVNKEILPVYHELGAMLPRVCPLAPPRDIYGYQEEMKYEESPAKWQCNMCGKSFYEERFLNAHFDSRHPKTIRTDADSVCLADYCDLFRCEVIAKARRGVSTYWDHALCREDGLLVLRSKCMELINLCVPEASSKDVQTQLLKHLNATLCSYLTCDTYWELHDTEISPISLAFYIVAGMVLIMGLMAYFMLLRSQLSQHSQALFHEEDTEQEPDVCTMRAPENQEIRYRHGTVPIHTHSEVMSRSRII